MEKFFSFISSFFIPLMAFIIILYGLIKKQPVYDYFMEGARKGLKTAVEILPFIIGIYIAINGFTSSGLLNFINNTLGVFFNKLGVPVELLPLMLLRAVSGSGSFIIVEDIMELAGPDSYTGRTACVMAGGCETVLYVLALYFSVTKVKTMRHAFTGGILSYLFGVVVSVIICNFL